MKENNCQCAICNVEASLLDSFSTQTARTQFQALASIYPVLTHFSSPLELVKYLHQQNEAANHNAASEIFHVVIHAIAEKSTEEFGQQLLLLAFTPAIHKLCREISQRFPSLLAEDIAQQSILCLLEAAKSTAIARQNGHLLLALVRTLRKNTFRWAIKEAHVASVEDESSELQRIELVSEDSSEGDFELAEFLRQCRSSGALSDADYELLLKFHCEEFEAAELTANSRWRSAKAVHHRLEKILNRLRRLAADPHSLKAEPRTASHGEARPHEKIFQVGGGISTGVCPFSNSEKGFSPELSHPIPQIETQIAQLAV